MSAFVCSNDHFIAIAVFATRRDHGSMRVDPRYVLAVPGFDPAVMTQQETADAYANILCAENVRSVNHRYTEHTPEDLSAITVTARDMCNSHLTAVSILKMLDCLEYQSCETEDYESTLAYKLLSQIRASAIRSIPGYETAPWSYDKPDAVRVGV